MKLEIKGYRNMEGQKFSKWHIFELDENSVRYQILAKDTPKGDSASAIAIQIFKEPVKGIATYDVYEVKIAYNQFDNIIWSGYVRKEQLKDKSGFFQMMLDDITKYENR